MHRYWASPFLLAGALSAFAQPSDDPVPSYALRSCNFRDLAMDGYCQGVSYVHALSRMPDDKLKKAFGDDILKSFRDRPQMNEEAALRLLRIFSVLQSQDKVKQMKASVSEIPTKQTLAANDNLFSLRSLKFLDKTNRASKTQWDRPRAIAESNRVIEEKFRFLQSEQGKKEGLLADLMVTTLTQPPTLLGGHSVYMVSAAKSGNKYVFKYLDPNLPKQWSTLTYDPKDADVQFSTDSSVSSSALASIYSVDEAYRAYSAAIFDLHQSPEQSAKMLLSFLRLSGGSPLSNDLYRDKSLADNTALLDHWYSQLKDLEAKSGSSPLAKTDLLDPNSILATDLNQEIEKATVFRGTVLLAAQNQLDLGCANFKRFFSRLLNKWEQESRISKREQANANVLVSGILTWVQSAPVDGERLGSVPLRNRIEAECLDKEVLPLLAQRVASQDLQLWSSLLNEQYIHWLLTHYNWSEADPQTRNLVYKNLSRLDSEFVDNKLADIVSAGNEPISERAALVLLDFRNRLPSSPKKTNAVGSEEPKHQN